MKTPEGEKTPLRPQSIGDLIDTTFRQYKRDFPLIVRISVFILLPYLVISSIINYSTLSTARSTLSQLMNSFTRSSSHAFHLVNPNQTFSAAHFSMDIPLFIVAIVAYPLAYGTVLHRVARTFLLNQRKSFGEALRFAASRLFQVIVTDIFAWMVVSIILTVAWIIAIVPIPIMSAAKVSPAATIPVAILLVLAAVLFTLWVVTRVSLTSSVVREEKRIFWPAMWQSWVLTRRNFWHSLGYLVIVYLMVGVIQGGISGIGTLMPPVVDVIVVGITTLFVAPFQMLAVANLYVDLRVRTDAPDLLEWMDGTDESEDRLN